MDGLRRQFVHDVQDRFLDVVRGGHVGVAQAEIADILCPYFLRPFLAVFKNGPDGGFLRTQFIHFFINH